MSKLRRITCLSALGAAALVAWACEKPENPLASRVEPPNFHEVLGAACFRMTGGGRIDKPEPSTATAQPKNTPDSRDFATFGFQARPAGCDQRGGSGHITWVDHSPTAPGHGFVFHGTVTDFFAVLNHYAGQPGQPDRVCGGFSGMGHVKAHDGTFDADVPFTVDHACDEGEPGVGHDHIGISISWYSRAGILTGGNIQKHRLTGAGA